MPKNEQYRISNHDQWSIKLEYHSSEKFLVIYPVRKSTLPYQPQPLTKSRDKFFARDAT